MSFLKDYKGNKSQGRLLATLCVVIATGCWLGGFWKVEAIAHAQNGVVSFLGAAVIFYNGSKIPEVVAANRAEGAPSA